ncbi:MAG: hypothetical protein AB8F34_10955 [Akkermansiaceae bacterium]
MLKYLGAACFLGATILICRGITDADISADDVNERAEVRFDPDSARSSRAFRGNRENVVTEAQRERAVSSLLAAADVEHVDGQVVEWSQANYQYHLSKLSPAGAKKILEHLLHQKSAGVYVRERSGAHHSSLENGLAWWSLQTNRSKLMPGLVSLLAKDDFRETVAWLESLPVLEKDKRLASSVFARALLAGLHQDPDEAWRVYQEKCPPQFG